MAKKKKVGKDRLDKFYHLAKDQGYRARSAYKLVQLAKKTDFLSDARVCIDLCGAPGGWSQVAAKQMPKHPSTKIICVDLVPTKPIPGVTTIQCDITQPKMRTILRKELEGRLADVVLNDGAPNVGANWNKDAYVQNELTLHATKLASEFLRPNGTYVTKVFRSSDYTSLLWVFQQLFKKVEATKPQASRNVSAEIFVICSGYKGNKNDPQLFDPKFVFQMDEDTDKALGVKDKKETASLADLIKYQCKKNRSGYADDGIVARPMSLIDFVKCTNPAQVLTTYAKFTYEDPESLELSKKMNKELLECCEDLKILGKRELTKMIKWRMLLRETHEKQVREVKRKEREEGDKVKELEEDDEDKINNELEKMVDEMKATEKRDCKKIRERKKKQDWRKKMSMGNQFMGMTDEPDLFKFQGINQDLIEKAEYIEESDDDEEDLENHEENYERKTQLIVNDNWDSELNRLAEMEAEQVMAARTDKEFVHKNQQQNKLRIDKERRREKKYREWGEEMDGFNANLDKQAEELHNAQALSESDSDADLEQQDNESDDDGFLGYNTETLKRDNTTETTEEPNSDDESDDGAGDDDAEHTGDITKLQVSEEIKAMKGKKSKNEPKAKKIVPEVELSNNDNQRADRWFSQGLFDGLLETTKDETNLKRGREYDEESEEDENYDSDASFDCLSDKDLPQIPLPEKKKRQEKRRRLKEKEAKRKELDARNGKKLTVEEKEKDEKYKKGEKKEEAFEVCGHSREFDEEVDLLPGQLPEHLRKPQTKEEMMAVQALGSLMIRKKSRMQLLDSQYNRYCYDDEELDLPEWFCEEESKNNKPELPVTKEMMDQFRAKMKDINSRPIRKVQEANARNKKRLQMRMDKVRKEAKKLVADTEMSGGAKARNMERIIRKAKTEGKKSTKIMAIKKAGGSTNATKGKATAGAKMKVVDKRLKKDKKGEARAAKKVKGRCAVKKGGKRKR